MGVKISTALAILPAILAAQVATAVLAGQTPPQRTTKDKVYTKDQASKAEPTYVKLCATCHDPAKVPAGKKPGPALVGDKFFDTWRDRTLDELLTIIETTMPNDGSAILSPDEAADLVAYVLQANGLPDGPTPLKPGAAARSIVIAK